MKTKTYKVELTGEEIEALICGAAEWLYQNKGAKTAEAREIKKALARAEKKLNKAQR